MNTQTYKPQNQSPNQTAPQIQPKLKQIPDSGNLRQLAEEVAAHAPMVYRYALKLTGNEHDAEDLQQDVMLRAMENLERYQPQDQLAAWLRCITHNIFIEQMRRRKWTTAKSAIKDEDFHLEANDGPRHLSTEDCRRVWDILPPNLCEPLQLFSEGYRYPEISRQLNIPHGTVKNRIFNARRILSRKTRQGRFLEQ